MKYYDYYLGSVACFVIQDTRRTEFDDSLRIRNYSEVENSLQRVSKYLRSIVPLLQGLGWTRFLKGQAKVKNFVKFCTIIISGINEQLLGLNWL